MTLRWITWEDEGAWHLRFGTDGPPICDRYIPGSTRDSTGPIKSRSLSAGPPAQRCPDCLTVIAFRLGLSSALSGAAS